MSKTIIVSHNFIRSIKHMPFNGTQKNSVAQLKQEIIKWLKNYIKSSLTMGITKVQWGTLKSQKKNQLKSFRPVDKKWKELMKKKMKNLCKNKEKNRRKCILYTIGIGKNCNKKYNFRIKRLEKEYFHKEVHICQK